jgi:hypothetical protein
MHEKQNQSGWIWLDLDLAGSSEIQQVQVTVIKKNTIEQSR